MPPKQKFNPRDLIPLAKSLAPIIGLGLTTALGIYMGARAEDGAFKTGVFFGTGITGLAMAVSIARYLQKRQLEVKFARLGQGRAANPRILNTHAKGVPWEPERVRAAMETIDWYQFEKLTVSMLSEQPVTVEWKGNKQAEGGVDILVTDRAGVKTLIQCKHWKNTLIEPATIADLVASMRKQGAAKGEIRTLKGFTKEAIEVATQAGIAAIDGHLIARLAAERLTTAQLDDLLKPADKHCPKCEAPMTMARQNGLPHWVCSRAPECRGAIRVW